MLGLFSALFLSMFYVFYLGFYWGKILMIFFFLFFLFFFFSYGWESYYGFFFLDSTSVVLISLSFLIIYLMYLASLRVNITKYYSFGFNFFLLFLSFVLVFCFSTSNLFFFFLFFEISLVPTLMIIVGWGYQPERLQAGFYMIMYTIFASLPFLGFLLFFCYFSGSFFMFFFFDFSFFGGVVFFSVYFISIFAFMVKLPIYGVHLWLPKAHVEAPVSGSMILAGVLLKLGGYGLYRVFFLFQYFFPFFSEFIIFFVVWGGCLTSLICLRQSDLKGLVAYSSVGHMAVLFAGYVVGSSYGVVGGLLMMVGHGLCSSCLFFLASSGYDLMGSRSVFLVKGMMTAYPSFSFWWFVFCSGNMSAPPSLNLCSELLIFMGVLGKSFFFFFFLGLMSFVVGAYSLYLFLSFSHGSLLEGVSFFNIFFSSFFLVNFMHFVPLFFGFVFCDLFLV
uniref:NADH-ubiquinone oxidoreductase chain 4 n=1 Tax=Tetrastemma olgarum TaxID=1526548 RepID=A0A0U1V279_9BILA|nr:NADH dehydrogenase subunit 4 [Tetrastemma olgarum]AIH00391.1 NADH dehydrogenase subunit 4 [Tetrastemma olgarum]